MKKKLTNLVCGYGVFLGSSLITLVCAEIWGFSAGLFIGPLGVLLILFSASTVTDFIAKKQLREALKTKDPETLLAELKGQVKK